MACRWKKHSRGIQTVTPCGFLPTTARRHRNFPHRQNHCEMPLKRPGDKRIDLPGAIEMPREINRGESNCVTAIADRSDAADFATDAKPFIQQTFDAATYMKKGGSAF